MTAAGRLRRTCRWLLALGMAVAPATARSASAPAATHPPPEDRHRLWMLVHDECAPAAARHRHPPLPCAEVDITHRGASGYAVLKDRAGRYQYLVLPLARITGIESPALLAPGAPNYFADAWTARLYVEAALHAAQPRDALGLVVNSSQGRSQDQLHIHVDCIRPDVHAALLRLRPVVTGRWRPLPAPLPPNGHAYSARWVDGETLAIDPFKSLAAALPAGDAMARHSLIVVGARSASGKPGFILLSGRVDRRRGDRGNGDELQDLACSIAQRPAH
jgi:CDP-diacylglycerol pyrophosphatase